MVARPRYGDIHAKAGRDDAEVDALGIYAILVDVKHSTNESKTDTKRKREAAEGRGAMKKDPIRKAWREEFRKETWTFRISRSFKLFFLSFCI